MTKSIPAIEPTLRAPRFAPGEQGLPPLDWSRQAVERVKGPETLRGRDRLRETLAGFGCALR